MFGSSAMLGLLAPLGKDAMNNGLDGISMVSFRVLGAALLFWGASLFVKSDRIPRRDIFLFAGAALLGIVFNQCLYTIGLNYTSPVNSTIVTTSMPVFAMILSFFILKEPITWFKAGGVLMGCCGAVMLVLGSLSAADGRTGDYRGDLMCMGAQMAYALYLSAFNGLVRKHNIITVNKWMFTWSAVMILPFSTAHMMTLPWSEIATKTWLEVGYVVFFGTFVSYMLSIAGQRVLRPTVVSVYNYVQPIVSVVVTVLMGLGVFTLSQGIAIILVFSGVWLVVKSKSRGDRLETRQS